MKKISVILPTNRLNSDVFTKIKQIQDKLDYDSINKPNAFTDEFFDLISDRLNKVTHYLEPTLKSLSKQKFKDFELVISHKYPEDAIDIVKKYKLPIKLIREKPSIWHKLGDEYGTLCNNINTAVIHSDGELIWRLDDLTFFNQNVTKELFDNWENKLYTTSRTIRCIETSDDYEKDDKTLLGPNKILIEKNGWKGEYKPLTNQSQIPKWMCWGVSSTISTYEFLELNGHDEVFDGAICGTDMELGMRLQKISKYNRVPSNNIIYEIDDVPYKHSTRDDVMFRQIIGDYGTLANSWKPSEKHIRIYKKWHTKTKGELDKYWDKFLNVPYINIKREKKEKRLGEIIYDSTNIY